MQPGLFFGDVQMDMSFLDDESPAGVAVSLPMDWAEKRFLLAGEILAAAVGKAGVAVVYGERQRISKQCVAIADTLLSELGEAPATGTAADARNTPAL
jgi:hypothetical protein